MPLPPQIVQAGQDTLAEIRPLFAIRFGGEPLFAHRLDRDIISRDDTILSHRFEVSPGYLVPTEIGRPRPHPALRRDIARFFAIEFQHLIDMEQVCRQVVDFMAKLDDAACDRRSLPLQPGDCLHDPPSGSVSAGRAY
jgi:hypothetical protein